MRWDDLQRSSNIEDRRGGGGGFGLPIGRAGGIGGLGLVAVVLVSMFLGVDPSVVLDGITGSEPAPRTSSGAPAERGSTEDFVAAVLGDTEQTWHTLLDGQGRRYAEPTLVMFSGATSSACGMGEAAMGPFYCPNDRRIFIDLRFFEEMRQRFKAPGDFAQAYVIAHEVGHHVQNLLGIAGRARQAQQGASRAEANRISVRVELQADCFAGLWAHHADRARNILEAGDVEEALNAASAIGDDRLQRQAQGRVVPDSFTHGTSEQRVRWFRRGLESGSLQACDTFNASSL